MYSWYGDRVERLESCKLASSLVHRTQSWLSRALDSSHPLRFRTQRASNPDLDVDCESCVALDSPNLSNASLLRIQFKKKFQDSFITHHSPHNSDWSLIHAFLFFLIDDQVVIVPCGITAKMSETATAALIQSCEDLGRDLAAGGVRTRVDARDKHSPGWKFNHWELKVECVAMETECKTALFCPQTRPIPPSC